MGLEGTRLWTLLTGMEARPSEASTPLTTTLTDGPADSAESSDSFLTTERLSGPDTSARPPAGHPLFACRVVSPVSTGTDLTEENPEDVIAAFEEELAHFESLLNGDAAGAAASLNQLECLAQQLEGLSREGLSDEGMRDREIAVLRSWSLVRTGIIRLSERVDGPAEVSLNDTEVSDRMREARTGLIEAAEVSDLEGARDLETRLNEAIDNDDAEFLASLTPEFVGNFLTTHEMARALRDFARESEGEDRLTASLESARLFGSLDLEGRVTETLGLAEAIVRELPEEADFLDGFLSISGVYQESGMIDEANRFLLQVSFVGENSLDPASRELGAMARAMRLVNQGELREAEEIVAALPVSEASANLLEGIREGVRRERVLENLGLYQGFINLYLETHPFAEGVDREALGAEFRTALEGAAADALSGETPDLWQALNVRATEVPALAGFLYDTDYGRRLEAVSAPEIERDEFEFRILSLADHYMAESDYNAAGIVAQVFCEDHGLRAHCEEYFRRIEYHTSRETLSRSGINFVGDWLSMTGIGLLESAGAFLSTMTAGFSGTGGSIEDDLPGTAEFALLIASEGMFVEADALFSTSRFGRSLSPLARSAGRWAVREGTMSSIMTPGMMLVDAGRRRSLDHLTLENFAREFGANLVLFSLAHGSGLATRGAPALVRWGGGVGAFAAADYVNEGIGFRDAREAGLGERLLDSMAGDARMRFASWLGNRMSGGRFERLRELSARAEAEHAESWRSRVAPARGRYVLMPLLLVGGGFGFVPIRRPAEVAGGTRRIGSVPEIGIRSLGLREVLANIGTSNGRFDQLAGLFETLPEYAALNRASRDAAETARIREEVSAELGGRFESLTRVSDALNRVLSRHGIDLVASRSGLDPRIASGEITARDASGLSRLASHLLYQFYPDGVPLFRSVHSEYAGLPGTMRESGSDWRVGERTGEDGALPYHEDGMVLITTTMGAVREAGGRFVIDPHAAVMDALTVVHPGGRRMPYEIVTGPEGDTAVSETLIPGPTTDIFDLLGTGAETPLPSLSPEPSLPPPGLEEAPVREERGTVREPLAGGATERPRRRAGRVEAPVREAVRRYGDLPAPLRSLIDRIMIGASADHRRIDPPTGRSLWAVDTVFTRRVESDGTLVISPNSTLARELFLSRLTAEEGATVHDLGGGRYQVSLEGGETYNLRVRLDGTALERLVDSLIAQGLNQGEMESRLAEEGLTTSESASVIGLRVSLAARGGRSEGGAH